MIRLFEFDVISKSPVADALEISGAHVIAPSRDEAWYYLGSAMESRARGFDARTFAKYDLVETGRRDFVGSREDWIQSQLKLGLALSIGDRAVMLPPQDDLLVVQDVMARPTPPWSERAGFSSEFQEALETAEVMGTWGAIFLAISATFGVASGVVAVGEWLGFSPSMGWAAAFVLSPMVLTAEVLGAVVGGVLTLGARNIRERVSAS